MKGWMNGGRMDGGGMNGRKDGWKEVDDDGMIQGIQKEGSSKILLIFRIKWYGKLQMRTKTRLGKKRLKKKEKMIKKKKK